MLVANVSDVHNERGCTNGVILSALEWLMLITLRGICEVRPLLKSLDATLSVFNVNSGIC